MARTLSLLRRCLFRQRFTRASRDALVLLREMVNDDPTQIQTTEVKRLLVLARARMIKWRQSTLRATHIQWVVENVNHYDDERAHQMLVEAIEHENKLRRQSYRRRLNTDYPMRLRLLVV